MSIDRGTLVHIARGPHAGTSGEVFWTGPDRFRGGQRLGIRALSGQTLWVHASAVEPAPSPPADLPPALGPTFLLSDLVCVCYRGQVLQAPVAWVSDPDDTSGQRIGLYADRPGAGDEPLWMSARELAPAPTEPMPRMPQDTPIPETAAGCRRGLLAADEGQRMAAQRGLYRLTEAEREDLARDIRIGSDDRMIIGAPGQKVAHPHRLNAAVARARAARRLGRSRLLLHDPFAADLIALTRLSGLHTLELRCRALRRVVLDLPDLRALTLRRCSSLTSLPGLERATSLETLTIEGCPSLCDLSALRRLPRLRSLVLVRCGVRDLAPLRGLGLRDVHIAHCTALRDFATLGTLAAAEALTLERLPVVALPDLSGMTALQTVELHDMAWLRSLRALRSPPPQLHSVVLDGAPALADLSGLEALPRLRHLDLRGCPQLTTHATLAEARGLETLDLSDSAPLMERALLSALPRLQRARLSCGRPQPSPAWAEVRFPALTGAHAAIPEPDERPKLRTAERRQLTKLRQLLGAPDPDSRTAGYELLVALDSEAMRLELARGVTVSAAGVVELTSSARRRAHLRSPEHRLLSALHTLRTCGRLQQATILDLTAPLSDHGVLSGLPALRHLRLQLRPGADLADLGPLPALEELVVTPPPDHTDLTAPMALSALARMPRLRRLVLRGCAGIVELSALIGLKELEVLDLSLTEPSATPLDLTALAGLGQLRHLYLRERHRLRNPAALSALRQLQGLDLSGSQIDDLAPLRSCAALERLWAERCDRLSDVLPVMELPWLQLVQLSAAPSAR